ESRCVITHRLSADVEARNVIELKENCSAKNLVDIAFVVDATGSMGDEISYLQAELNDVIGRVEKVSEGTSFRTGAVFYQDEGDSYLTRRSSFSSKLSKTTEWIAKQSAGGGGDYPEAVEEGLQDALNLNWSEAATARLLFLVLDAPPHHTPAILEKLQQQIRLASEMGIKIIPVTASGIDRETEFLMKMMAILTNGTYVFITDDSGIGNAHLKPAVEDFEVELLNDLLVRLISNYANQDHCEEQQYANTPFKVFPNPAFDFTKVEIKEDKTELVVMAANGKVVMREKDLPKGEHQIDVQHLAAGFYTVQLWTKEEKVATKLIITNNS
ncbi:MAG: T9SS type A sorting domain-containing protein, partial [Bacteroidota bacterium]